MSTTTNFGLKKPGLEESADIGNLNYNADIIDGELDDNGQGVADLASAVGNVDVPNDGSLQHQIDTLRDSVSLRLQYGRTLSSSDDLNSLPTGTGIYVNNGSTPTHVPTQVSGEYWYMLYLAFGLPYQIIFSNEALYTRRYAAGAWQSWAKATYTWM